MNQQEIKQYIEKIQMLGSVYGLDSIKELLRRLGNPQDKLKIVHIAGTNGKGSILAMISQIIQEAGYQCGRYISPTIFTYLERFQINGTYMAEEELEILMTLVARQADEMEQDGFSHPTLFEIETAIAFLWFAQKQVDLVLLETGLGGRLDSTNVVASPLCVLFSSISRDHMAILGDTLEEIAKEKAGIIKRNVPIISYDNPKEVQMVLVEEARKLEAPIQFTDKEAIRLEQYSIDGQVFSYKNYIHMELSLLGEHQLQNAAVVLDAIAILKKTYHIDETAIRSGLKNVQWQGRFEVLQKNPIWIRDGAHNEDAAKQLKQTLERYVLQRNVCFPQKEMDYLRKKGRIFYIMGVFLDKEYETMLQILAPLSDMIVTIETIGNQRALSSNQLAQVTRKYGTNVMDGKTLEQAVSFVKLIAKPEDIVVVFGSLSFIGELKL